MKILRIIASIAPVHGGTTEAARSIDQELVLRGHTVEVLCLDDPKDLVASQYPAKVHAVGPSVSSFKLSYAMIHWLKLNLHLFDVVIVDGLWQFHGIAFWLVRKISSSTIPYFVFPHGMLDPWFKKAYPIKHFKKLIYWLFFERLLIRDSTSLIFTCEEEKIQSRKCFPFYGPKETIVSLGIAPPVITPNLSDFLSKYNLTGKRVILFLSRIHEKKGCDLLIDAFGTFARGNDNIHLIMAGPDSSNLSEQLREKAKNLEIEKQITWTGMLVGEEKWAAFKFAELFCLPSHQENFGLVVAEALACGRPVLISNKVNIWREIETDGAGIVQEDTVQGTLQGLETWFALSPQAQKDMQDAAQKCFNRRFRIDRTTDCLINLLQSANAKLQLQSRAGIKDLT